MICPSRSISRLIAIVCLLSQFAAEFTEKMLFKSIMIRLLKSALSQETPDYTAMLREEVLSVDGQLLDIEQATMEISGNLFINMILLNNVFRLLE